VRILVIGAPASGKTYFAKNLARNIGISSTSMDDLYWNEGWKRPNLEDFHKKLQNFLHQKKWILDGNFFHIAFQDRLDAADTVIWLHCPLYLRTYRYATRELMRSLKLNQQGLPEKISKGGAFSFGFLWRKVINFDRNIANPMREKISQRKKKVIEIHASDLDLLSDRIWENPLKSH